MWAHKRAAPLLIYVGYISRAADNALANCCREVAPTTSNENGHFIFPVNNRGYLILASKGNQQLSTYNDAYNHGRINNPRPYDRTIFFTDRSLYRPGQTIEYKGLAIHVDQHIPRTSAG